MTPFVAGIFDPLLRATEAGISVFHDQLGFGWGMSIVAFTILLRILILPLSISGIRKMRQLQELQPHMKALQERYGQDRERMQREMMALYKKHDVNPLASCFPLLLQIPFFILLFYTLRGQEFKEDVLASGADGQGWLFIDNLVSKPGDATEVIILIALFVGTQFLAAAVTASRIQGAQRLIAFGLPLIFATFVPTFPSGLSVYWITTNIWTFGQQLVVVKVAPPPEPPTAEEIEAAKPPPPPPRKKRKKRA